MKSITEKVAEMAVEIYFDETDMSVQECVEKAERIVKDEENKRLTENNLY